ncbi:hypothetical protein SEA_APIARY_12 [Rhodococcus phage Apiary]|nr:hypothetical protein SEA_BRAXOADDIE_12 [Rhodococcus phage Braxoaddie]WNM67396.1 hypothetical protein SEA_POLYYUKI_12 [Rhodococcus phage Polyyuki]WNM69820.1 hypothetical protein SEA_APIARY_12 [Rhodococcus phage Apiary]
MTAAMTDERRTEIDKIAMDVVHKSQTGAPLSHHEEALADTVRHLAVVEMRNGNLSQQYRIANNSAEQLSEIVVRVTTYAAKLEQAVRVAEGGVLVGEVEAMRCILSDLHDAISGENQEEAHRG